MTEFYFSVQQLRRKFELQGLGIEFGYNISISDYGIVGLAIASTRCFAEALDTQMRFLKMITNADKIFYKLSSQNRFMTLEIGELNLKGETDQFLLEAELSAQLRLIKDLLPSVNTSECSLYLPYECPTKRHLYQKFLGCQVLFKQREAKLVFPLEWMDKPLQTTDELLAPLLTERCQFIMARMEASDNWVLRVRNYLLTSGAHMQSLSSTAVALNVPMHKLRELLYKCDTSYKQIILEVRMQLACQYLEDTHLTLQQISYQLGYHQPSNFQLAFKKFFQVAPGQWRSDAMKT